MKTGTKVLLGIGAAITGVWAYGQLREKKLFSAPPGWDSVTTREGRIAFCRTPPKGYEAFCAQYLRMNA